MKVVGCERKGSISICFGEATDKSMMPKDWELSDAFGKSSIGSFLQMLRTIMNVEDIAALSVVAFDTRRMGLLLLLD